jgi:hypothetical protein
MKFACKNIDVINLHGCEKAKVGTKEKYSNKSSGY